MAGQYNQLYNSSRGSVFIIVFFSFFGFLWCLYGFLKRKYILVPDRYLPGYPPAPVATVPTVPDAAVAGSTNVINVPPTVVPPGTRQPEPVPLSGMDKLYIMFEEFLLDYFCFVIVGILSVVMFRCWAYSFVNWFIVLVPMIIFNMFRCIPTHNLVFAWLCKYFGLMWVMGWFINIWTIKSYA